LHYLSQFKKEKLLQYILILLFFVSLLKAQVSFKNRLEFTRWQEDGREYWTNWTDLTYQHQWLQMGLRYEINRPPDPTIYPQPSLLKNYELTYYYANLRYKRFAATIGNFYALFGRGLTLRTYEDRNLRVDNNIRGAKIQIKTRKFKMQALGGMMRDKYNRRKNRIYGLDGEIEPLKHLRLGSSILRQDQLDYTAGQLLAIRMSYSHNWWDFYTEIARPGWNNDFSNYTALNLSFSKLTATLEYKNYNHLAFTDSLGTHYSAAPSLTREHMFTALNRHPHQLNMDDEKGYQLELTYNISDEIQTIFNHSQTYNHRNVRYFQEFYSELIYTGQTIELHAAADWAYDYTSRTENITPLIDGTYNFSQRDQIHLSLQHQHTKNTLNKGEYDNELFLAEYSRSPFMSAALVTEYTNKNLWRNLSMKRHFWIYGNLTFNFWHNQQLSLLYGSRREGFICVGGVCRREPEFEGVEIRLTNRF